MSDTSELERRIRDVNNLASNFVDVLSRKRSVYQAMSVSFAICSFAGLIAALTIVLIGGSDDEYRLTVLISLGLVYPISKVFGVEWKFTHVSDALALYLEIASKTECAVKRMNDVASKPYTEERDMMIVERSVRKIVYLSYIADLMNMNTPNFDKEVENMAAYLHRTEPIRALSRELTLSPILLSRNISDPSGTSTLASARTSSAFQSTSRPESKLKAKVDTGKDEESMIV